MDFAEGDGAEYRPRQACVRSTFFIRDALGTASKSIFVTRTTKAPAVGLTGTDRFHLLGVPQA